MRHTTRLASLLSCLFLVAACGAAVAPQGSSEAAPSTGRSATPAISAASTPPRGTISPQPTEGPMQTPAPIPSGPFSLTSAAFEEGGAIPRRFTCDGADVSPPLAWSSAPAGTASLALIVDDPDARGFVHWVVFDIPGAPAGGLAEGWSTSHDAAPQGTNSFGDVGYGGPCPPSGTHRYVFRLLALDARLLLAGAPKAAAVLTATEGHVLAEARLDGRYSRGS